MRGFDDCYNYNKLYNSLFNAAGVERCNGMIDRLIILSSFKKEPAKFWSDVVQIAVLQKTGQAEEYTINHELIQRRLKENSKGIK